MPLIPYAVRTFLRNPSKALLVYRVTRELRRYTVWRLYDALESSGLLSRLQEQPWWEFADRDLARWVCDILVENGCAVWSGDAIRVASPPRPCRVMTREAADMLAVIDRAVSLIPSIVETGGKPSLAEYRAEYAKTVGNFAHRLAIEVCLEETGVAELLEGSTVLDVMAKIGAATFALLEMTGARVIAVEPLPENVEVLARAVKLAGQEERVTIVQVQPEQLKLSEKVDAAVMADTIPYLLNPGLALRRVRENLKERGFLAVYQCLYSGTGLTAFLPHYVFGANRPPPRSSELRELLRESGFTITKWLEEMGVAVVRAEPS